MSNIYQFPVSNQKEWPVQSMSDQERDGLCRTIQKLANDREFPISRILTRLAISAQEYPLEDIVVKDLEPKGFLLTARYPNHNLNWIFRLESTVTLEAGKLLKELDLLAELEAGVVRLGVASRAARFPYRFLSVLGEMIRIVTVVSDSDNVVVSGLIHETPLGLRENRPYLPFKMTLTKY